MFKKLLTIFLLATITLVTIMPDNVWAKGRRNSGRKAVAAKKGGRVAKARASKGGRRAVVVRGKAKGGRYIAKSRGRGRGKYVRRYENDAPRVSRTPGVAIPPDRVREIQTALKREGYLQTEPSGQYDRTTVEAMTKYQQDNSFRTTGYPTAESLQKLGLTRQRRVTQTAPVENKPDNSSNSGTPPQIPDFNR